MEALDEIQNTDSTRLHGLLTRRQLLQRAAWLGLAAGPGSALLAACGQSAPPAAGPGRFKGQSINVMMIQPHALAGKILAQDFEAATGAKVNVTAVPYDQVQAKATLDVQSGAAQFDVFDYWYTTVGALARDHIIEDLTDYIQKNSSEINPSDYISSIYDPYTLYHGRRYGLPFDGDSHILFYNTEIFARHGLKAPNTWDEYLEIARAITQAESKNGIYGCALMAQQAPIIIDSSYSNRLAGFGGSYFDSHGNPALNTTAAKLAAKAMLDVAPYALPTPLETAFDQALPAFLQGKVAMMEFWTDLGVYSQDPKQSKIVDKWDVVQLPVGGSNTRHVAALDAGFGMAVSTASKHKEIAREFVKFATSQKENLKLITTTGSGIDPTHISTLRSEVYATFTPKIQKAAAASLSGSFPWPTIPESPALMQKLSDELALVLQGKKDPDLAMEEVQTAWKGILKR